MMELILEHVSAAEFEAQKRLENTGLDLYTYVHSCTGHAMLASTCREKAISSEDAVGCQYTAQMYRKGTGKRTGTYQSVAVGTIVMYASIFVRMWETRCVAAAVKLSWSCRKDATCMKRPRHTLLTRQGQSNTGNQTKENENSKAPTATWRDMRIQLHEAALQLMHNQCIATLFCSTGVSKSLSVSRVEICMSSLAYDLKVVQWAK